MAKHFYHIPLQNALRFIKSHKTELNRVAQKSKERTYYALLGKSYYTLHIEEFLHFFKIDKNIDVALKSIEYFHSTIFIETMHKVLNFSQFDVGEAKEIKKNFFYAFCYHYAKQEPEAFAHFMQKTLLHYHTSFNTESNIQIDYQDMCIAVAKSKKLSIKESFGEEEEKKEAFFKLFLDGIITIEERGKRIKTLRKKAYKRLFFVILERGES